MSFAPAYPLLHRALKPLFPSCLWSGNDADRTIALTFDDGPHPRYTPQLLEQLERYSVTASFFWLGACVHRSPAIARAVHTQGHWLGLHGYDHQSFPLLSESALRQTLIDTQVEITRACQLPPTAVRDVRPPNGLFTPHTLALLQQWEYRPVMWSVVPEDWVRPGATTVVQRILQQVKNGSIIVLHDGYHGGADVAETAAQLIPLLLAQNYRFVSINQLWQGRS
ncbi:chitooligosaccharide deacetylase NodB-like protein [Stenomitos frigidus ULC18]|uniref:Chitooligosaccharide deacetylase NodB-like protein n=1 Tax=Stenomitos frigidus ULC18 TaxID=2107698 RepID=A0A2T1E1A0_9CYAN|nr:chitooligosaccharide deacetylase NodB-like protein [Stenomitos frigidus ULC18]